MKNLLAVVFICFGIFLAPEGYCNRLDDDAKALIKSVVESTNIQPGFFTLSPELVTAITKSYYLLNESLPDLLKGSGYYEFGLYKGFSLWFAQQVGMFFTDNRFQYFGFDSFCGLPDQSIDYSQEPGWRPGVYATTIEDVVNNLEQHGADFSNLHLIEGWFENELFFSHQELFDSTLPAIITIDSDTYESCREILAFFPKFFRPGTILLFDDFYVRGQISLNNHRERRAILEFLAANKDYRLMHLFPFGWHGYAFMVTSCRGMSLDEKTVECVKRIIGDPDLPDHFPNLN